MAIDFDKLILDEGPNRIDITNREHVVVHWRRGAETVSGNSADEALGGPAAPVERGRRHGGDDTTSLRRRKDGTEFPLEISLSPIRTGEGRLVMSAIRAISDRKRIERTLNEQKQALEQANQAKDRFPASMSHELRTPLNAILGSARLLASKTLPITPDQRVEFTTSILQAGRHRLSLINEILDLAKIESGTLSLSLGPVSLAEVQAECHSMMAPQAEQRNVRLVFPDSTSLHVQVDRIRLKQILLKLLSNAIKYERPQGSVLVSCGASGDGPVRLSVQDTGAGLHANQISDLFQPFQRLGQEGGTEEGTGIGLVVTKRLAELMGGSIAVTSTPGIGSVFTVMLPPAEAPQPVPAPACCAWKTVRPT